MKRTLWLHPTEDFCFQILDQRRLPHEIIVRDIYNSAQAVDAIKKMAVRGAPLIAATAAYGIWLACVEAKKRSYPEKYLSTEFENFKHSRPTAVNLFIALKRISDVLNTTKNFEEKIKLALLTAQEIVDEDIAICKSIGEHGLEIIKNISAKKNGDVVNILTHCNAGRLGCIEYGTATAPMYLAHARGIKIHVWVDETRPRNQGANLTAWELLDAGIPHTVIVDNAGGHLMQHGAVDLVIVGTDRTTRTGDVANKIGTYLKALAAHDNNIPFYVALPSTTIDWKISDGLKEIPIEERSADEVKYAEGWNGKKRQSVLLTPKGSNARNFGFDVTPARLVTGLITERGICAASEKGLLSLFFENKL